MTALAFKLPQALEATEPPEARGVGRDKVRMLVARRGGALEHRSFAELPDLLTPGDLVVINVSKTLPAAIDGIRADGTAVRVHVATRAPRLAECWRVVELRSPDGASPAQARAGERIALAAGASIELVAPYASGPRLMLARLDLPETVERYLNAHGEPIRYRYVERAWPLQRYQNVYATVPGSAEMPSAGRPFTTGLLTRLIARGVLVAPIVLHAGVSSPERHEPPFPEYFEVSAQAARLVREARGWGGRVIAVGTTVVRALETAAGGSPEPQRSSGWTGRRDHARARRPRGRRVDHRLARARGLTSADARGDRRALTAAPILRGGPGARLPVARVWRQPPDPSLTTPPRARLSAGSPVGAGRAGRRARAAGLPRARSRRPANTGAGERND